MLGGGKKKRSAGESNTPVRERSQDNPDGFHLPEDLGRRYARVAGDYNPIHQRAWMARPFGFKRAIIHGMWTLGWAIHEPGSRSEPAAMHVVGNFKRPIPMPGDIQREILAADNGGFAITVWRQDIPKPCLEVTLNPRI